MTEETYKRETKTDSDGSYKSEEKVKNTESGTEHKTKVEETPSKTKVTEEIDD